MTTKTLHSGIITDVEYDKNRAMEAIKRVRFKDGDKFRTVEVPRDFDVQPGWILTVTISARKK